MRVQIMAIGNVTPDSFYAGSRLETEKAFSAWVESSLEAGADILDIGGCSTRPGSIAADEEEEWRRLQPALAAVRTIAPEAQLSLDTFDAFGAMIINDVSGGSEAMYGLVRSYRVPYIWTLRGDLQLPSRHTEMNDIDLILDPGFGFTGSTESDYECMRHLDELRTYGRPILAGVSRKSMVYKPLGLTPETCMTATQVLQFYALEHGATILRTHDVAETKQVVRLYEMLMGTPPAPLSEGEKGLMG